MGQLMGMIELSQPITPWKNSFCETGANRHNRLPLPEGN